MAKLGRPSDALKHKFERILQESNAYEKFKQILIKTKKEENFMRAFEICHDRAFGKAPQFTEMELNDVTNGPTKLEIRSTLERLNGANSSNGAKEDNSSV